MTLRLGLPPDHRLIRWLTSDEAGLVILGLLGFAHSLAIATPPVPSPPELMMEMMIPPMVWAWVWAVLGALSVVSIGVKRVQPMAVGMMAALHFLWGLSALIGGGLGWGSSLSYWAVFWLVWWGYMRGQRNPRVVSACQTPPHVNSWEGV